MHWRNRMQETARAGVLVGMFLVSALGHTETAGSRDATAGRVEQLLQQAATTSKGELFAITNLVTKDPAAAQRRLRELQAQMARILAETQAAHQQFTWSVMSAAAATSMAGASGSDLTAGAGTMEAGADETSVGLWLRQCQQAAATG